jgi:hypothetical protein
VLTSGCRLLGAVSGGEDEEGNGGNCTCVVWTNSVLWFAVMNKHGYHDFVWMISGCPLGESFIATSVRSHYLCICAHTRGRSVQNPKFICADISLSCKTSPSTSTLREITYSACTNSPWTTFR